MDVYVKLNKLPITNMKIIIEPMRNDNGYRPFFMSTTVDFCRYMRNPNLQKMTLFTKLYANIRNVSNLNHTCPYNNDIVLEKFWTGDLEKGLTKYLPIPNGQYALFSKWFTSNILRANLNVYFKVLN
ncbi:hypothetical protein M5D96_010297 [Drosophila gunungcola]|uniref:Uncharacterized protein n=2 Tax=Drosophila gunungcola TaxID=103775 RepID=A0A9Q0BM68_9MUSC|nr:hypothetical protein M5D96_010297 [Drosophila gunungcola]